MDSAWTEISRALAQAREIRDASQQHANAMAALLVEPGVLRKVWPQHLERLKRELANFNIQTGKWKP